jgi:hypothetical protein
MSNESSQEALRMISDDDLDRLELEDQAEVVGFLTPREYAKLRGKSPQLIYYHIRNKHIDIEPCRCGRKVLEVALADKFFGIEVQDGQ